MAVIAGDYRGKIFSTGGAEPTIVLGWHKRLPVNKETVAEYEVLNVDSSKSASGTLVKGAMGEALFGDVGMLAGALSSQDDYLVAVLFKDGKRSLIEMTAKDYKEFLRVMF